MKAVYLEISSTLYRIHMPIRYAQALGAVWLVHWMTRGAQHFLGIGDTRPYLSHMKGNWGDFDAMLIINLGLS